MNFILKIKLFSLAALSLVYSGCGGVGAEPLDATTGAFVLGTLNTNLIQTLPRTNAAPTLPIGGITTAAIDVSRNSTPCETVTPTTTVDADNDQIAAYKKYTYDCTDLPTQGYTYTRKGYVEIRDKDESVAGMYGGIRVDFNVPTFKSTSIASGTTNESSYSGYWDYINQNGVLSSDSSYTGSTKYKTENGFDNDYTYTASWKYKLTPTSTTAPWQSGAVDIEGSFILSGKFVFEDQATNTHSQKEGGWTITYKSSNLVYESAGCTQFYKSGSFIMSDSANTIEIVYNCNTAKLYLNGTESSWLTF